MAQQTQLDVSPRTVMGKANKRLRKEGLLPGNIYGHKEEPIPVQIDAVAFDRLRREHGMRNVISLRIPNAPAQTVLVRHIQHEPKTGNIIHVDFTRVSLSERLTSKVPLHYVGEAPGVKIEGGILLHLVDAVSVECAARDIVDFIEVDISSLTEINSVLHASDIKLPSKYKLLTDPAEPIAKIDPPRVEVPAVAAEEAPAAAEAPAAEAPEATQSTEE